MIVAVWIILILIIGGMALYELWNDGVFAKISYWWKTRT